jgi:hypothetical protein
MQDADGATCTAGQGGASVALASPNAAGFVGLHTNGAPGRVSLHHDGSQFRLGGGVTTWAARVLIETLSTIAEEYIAAVGISLGESPGDRGVNFVYDRLTSPNWIMVCQDGGGTTSTPTAVPVTTGWVTLSAVVNAAATSVEFFINGVSVGTVVTNIPDGATEFLTTNFSASKSAGAADRTFYVDYYGFTLAFTTPRL